MDVFQMVVMIVLIVTVGRIIQAKVSHNRRKGSATGSGTDDAETVRLRQEVRGLKERIAVLERLVTDETGPRALEREIEALRSRDA